VGRQNNPLNQCCKPTGWLGRLTLWRMNLSHSRLTDWGLSYASVKDRNAILDVGCGGGKTIDKLAAMAPQARVYGVDHSEESVAAAKRTNARWIDTGRVEIQLGSVSHLPFADNMFDLVTGVETHFWWPDLRNDMREIYRVTKPGGTLILIAEVYKGANTMAAKVLEQRASQTGMTLLSVDEHAELLVSAGYSEVQIVNRNDGWICATGVKPMVDPWQRA
jgi:ubiquinone/menaquinone biosynthesis C-methylase UbiE